jgi:hypothetical protein
MKHPRAAQVRSHPVSHSTARVVEGAIRMRLLTRPNMVRVTGFELRPLRPELCGGPPLRLV